MRPVNTHLRARTHTHTSMLTSWESSSEFGSGHVLGADTVREVVEGEFVELSCGGERGGTGWGGGHDTSLSTRVSEETTCWAAGHEHAQNRANTCPCAAPS